MNNGLTTITGMFSNLPQNSVIPDAPETSKAIVASSDQRVPVADIEFSSPDKINYKKFLDHPVIGKAFREYISKKQCENLINSAPANFFGGKTLYSNNDILSASKDKDLAAIDYALSLPSLPGNIPNNLSDKQLERLIAELSTFVAANFTFTAATAATADKNINISNLVTDFFSYFGEEYGDDYKKYADIPAYRIDKLAKAYYSANFKEFTENLGSLLAEMQTLLKSGGEKETAQYLVSASIPESTRNTADLFDNFYAIELNHIKFIRAINTSLGKLHTKYGKDANFLETALKETNFNSLGGTLAQAVENKLFPDKSILGPIGKTIEEKGGLVKIAANINAGISEGGINFISAIPEAVRNPYRILAFFQDLMTLDGIKAVVNKPLEALKSGDETKIAAEAALDGLMLAPFIKPIAGLGKLMPKGAPKITAGPFEHVNKVSVPSGDAASPFTIPQLAPQTELTLASAGGQDVRILSPKNPARENILQTEGEGKASWVQVKYNHIQSQLSKLHEAYNNPDLANELFEIPGKYTFEVNSNSGFIEVRCPNGKLRKLITSKGHTLVDADKIYGSSDFLNMKNAVGLREVVIKGDLLFIDTATGNTVSEIEALARMQTGELLKNPIFEPKLSNTEIETMSKKLAEKGINLAKIELISKNIDEFRSSIRATVYDFKSGNARAITFGDKEKISIERFYFSLTCNWAE